MSNQDPMITKVSDAIASPPERETITAFLENAHQTMAQLTELDFGVFEKNQSSAVSLDLWESIAPAVKETLDAVNSFLANAKETFPIHAIDSDTDVDFDFLLGDADTEKKATTEPPKSAFERASSAIVTIALDLANQVTRFGEGLRKPVVMTDQWFLLDHVQMFRGRFRAGIGEMMFQIATSYVNAERVDVVPGYAEEIKTTVSLRREIDDYRGKLLLLRGRLDEFDDPGMCRAITQEMVGVLDVFLSSDAFASMRAGDRREIVDSHDKLGKVSRAAVATRPESVRAAEGMARLFESLGLMNRRETLVVHDTELRGAILSLVDQGFLALTLGREKQAHQHVLEVHHMLPNLRGRDELLDQVIRVLEQLNTPREGTLETVAYFSLVQRHLRALHI